METERDAPQVQALHPEEAIAYVRKKGWQPVPHPNDNIEVFQGKADDSGQQIQLVLPKHPDLWDSSILLAKAINLLAAIEKKSPQEILTAIQSGAMRSSLLGREKITELYLALTPETVGIKIS